MRLEAPTGRHSCVCLGWCIGVVSRLSRHFFSFATICCTGGTAHARMFLSIEETTRMIAISSPPFSVL